MLLGPQCHPRQSLPRGNQSTPEGIKTSQEQSLLAWDSSRDNPPYEHPAQSRYSLGTTAAQGTEFELLPTAKGYWDLLWKKSLHKCYAAIVKIIMEMLSEPLNSKHLLISLDEQKHSFNLDVVAVLVIYKHTSSINCGISFFHKAHSVFLKIQTHASKVSWGRSRTLHGQQLPLCKKSWTVCNVVLTTMTASSHRPLSKEGILTHQIKWVTYGKGTPHFATTANK